MIKYGYSFDDEEKDDISKVKKDKYQHLKKRSVKTTKKDIKKDNDSSAVSG